MFGVDEDAVIKMKKDPANLCNNTSKISPTISLVKVLNEMQIKDVNKMSVKEFNASLVVCRKVMSSSDTKKSKRLYIGDQL